MDARVKKILNSPIYLLPLSENFKKLTIQKGYRTLNEIMSMPIRELMSLNWFTSDMLGELGEFIYDTRNNTGGVD
ncbi:MAG: hypothetical protein JWQ30_2127 [Sediminibacterium sp.]|nr:hypothetical protein [Sediminibacterium sp.]